MRIGDVSVDRCPSCGGLWFERDELRLAKDKKAPEARWVDIELKDQSIDWFQFELWKDKLKFRVKRGKRYCPSCETPLHRVNYGDSPVEIDVCGICSGIWLDRGEFKKIIDYVKSKVEYEVLNRYTKNLLQETEEIFAGPESMRSEAADLFVLVKLLKYKLAVQYPELARLFSGLPLSQ